MGIRGIGGVFFKAADPEALAAWYEQHLGVHRDAEGYTVLGWRAIDRPGQLGQTVWPFPLDTKYFEPGDASWMVNYRVDDLDAELARLEAEGVTLIDEPQEFEYGRFAWGLDCEGNKFELWEAPPTAPFPVTVPDISDPGTPRVWLCDPGAVIATTGAEMDARVIVEEGHIPLPVEETWRLWTTAEGLAEWLVESSLVELRVGGPYEFYFDPNNEAGLRGGEGNKVLAFVPSRMLAFTWNAPPKFTYTRPRHTHVVVDFEADADGTHVRLTHLGWPSSEADPHPEWLETFAYFEAAWQSVFEALSGHAGK